MELARWRETGEWWTGEPVREVVRFVDRTGVRREKELILPTVGKLRGGAKDYAEEDHREEWAVRVHKVRDEKIARACGFIREIESSPYLASKSNDVAYAPLHVYSGYAFGRGTMLAEEIPLLAASIGIPSIALADPFSLVGAVEFAKRAKAAGIKPLIGASLELPCGGMVVLLATNKHGYLSLSKLISECHLGEPRLYPLCTFERLERHARGLLCLTGGDSGPLDPLIVGRRFPEARRLLERLIATYGRSSVIVEIERSFLPWEIEKNRHLLQLAERCGVLPVAGGIVSHARPEHFPTQDVLLCADTLCTIEEIAGRKPKRHPAQPRRCERPERALNAERYLRTPREMSDLFADRLDLLTNTLMVAERCEDDVLPGRTRLPDIVPDPNHAIREAAFAGALERHGRIDQKLKTRLEFELDRICRLNFAPHFLAIWDACVWARDSGILFSGRGSVVDSAVAYCLGLSRIDAHRHSLHFDRFLPEDGSKRPDIDIDFEARHRDRIREYFARKYGEDRVAGVAAIGAYCTRGIVREVGKVFGLPDELISFLAKRLHGGVTPDRLEAALEKRPELSSSSIPKERFRWVFELSERMMDLPRNMRAHSSGIVLSSRPICETAPVMWSASPFVRERLSSETISKYFDNELSDVESISRSQPDSHGGRPQEDRKIDLLRIIQWDKRSCKYFFDKFDVLCLRGQDVLSGAEERIRVSNSGFKVESVSLEDEQTYRAMRSGELIGIPQSASPAMRQAHMRLRTANLHDASLVQAGIRPGVGGAVKINELIARRRGKPYSFEHPEFEKILGLSYGIIVFQEQVDQILQVFGGCTSGEAEDIRESIHKRRREDYGKQIKDQIVSKVAANGYSESVAEKVYELVSGFNGYGFAQGHALSFAEVSIRSIYCMQNYPAEYFASILSAQPAGYYGSCTLVNEARSRGIAILPPDVNLSQTTFGVEDVKSSMDPRIVLPSAGIRVGMMQLRGLSSGTREGIARSREDHPFSTFFDFAARVRPNRDELETLILSGALDSLCKNRRAMLWAIPEVQEYAHALSSQGGLPFEVPEPQIDGGVEDFCKAEKALYERTLLDLDVEKHLMSFERERVSRKGGITTERAKLLPNRAKAIVVGNPIRLRFPPTPSGKRVVFFDLEDETGLLNVTCFDAVYQRDGHAIVCSPYVTLIGEAQDRDGHTAFLARRVFPYKPMLGSERPGSPLPLATADFLHG